MLTGLIAACLALGTAEVSAGLGGATPLGVLEFNHRGGVLFTAGAGLNFGRSQVGIEGAFLQLPGSLSPDYRMHDWRVGLVCDYSLVRKVQWQLRAGLGLEMHHLSRELASVTERGSVPGARLQFTYLYSFGQPRFLFQLFGSELIETARLGTGTSVLPATVIGAKLGVAYEF